MEPARGMQMKGRLAVLRLHLPPPRSTQFPTQTHASPLQEPSQEGQPALYDVEEGTPKIESVAVDLDEGRVANTSVFHGAEPQGSD